jgi:hypothetical protein
MVNGAAALTARGAAKIVSRASGKRGLVESATLGQRRPTVLYDTTVSDGQTRNSGWKDYYLVRCS